jgi:hypothetical protein
MPLGARVEKWLTQLTDPLSKERLKAAERLSKTSEFYFHERRITSSDRYEVICGICPFSTDVETPVRACVAQLIGLIREWHAEVKAALGLLLQDTEPTVLIPAVWAAGAIGSHAAPLVSKLLLLASHPNRDVRWRVPWTLSMLKVGDVKVATALVQLAVDQDYLARMYAFDAMAGCQVDPSTVFDAVVHGLDDDDCAVQAGACRAIASISHDWTPLEPKLFELFRKGHLDAVIAICKNWPHKIHDPEINGWLQKNRGYWWAENLLTRGVMK